MKNLSYLFAAVVIAGIAILIAYMNEPATDPVISKPPATQSFKTDQEVIDEYESEQRLELEKRKVEALETMAWAQEQQRRIAVLKYTSGR